MKNKGTKSVSREYWRSSNNQARTYPTMCYRFHFNEDPLRVLSSLVNGKYTVRAFINVPISPGPIDLSSELIDNCRFG